jgi:hypothetical protein
MCAPPLVQSLLLRCCEGSRACLWCCCVAERTSWESAHASWCQAYTSVTRAAAAGLPHGSAPSRFSWQPAGGIAPHRGSWSAIEAAHRISERDALGSSAIVWIAPRCAHRSASTFAGILRGWGSSTLHFGASWLVWEGSMTTTFEGLLRTADSRQAGSVLMCGLAPWWLECGLWGAHPCVLGLSWIPADSGGLGLPLRQPRLAPCLSALCTRAGEPSDFP